MTRRQGIHKYVVVGRFDLDRRNSGTGTAWPTPLMKSTQFSRDRTSFDTANRAPQRRIPIEDLQANRSERAPQLSAGGHADLRSLIPSGDLPFFLAMPKTPRGNRFAHVAPCPDWRSRRDRQIANRQSLRPNWQGASHRADTLANTCQPQGSGWTPCGNPVRGLARQSEK